MEVYSDKINMSFRKASILIAVVTFLFLTPIFVIIIIRANNKKKYGLLWLVNAPTIGLFLKIKKMK